MLSIPVKGLFGGVVILNAISLENNLFWQAIIETLWQAARRIFKWLLTRRVRLLMTNLFPDKKVQVKST